MSKEEEIPFSMFLSPTYKVRVKTLDDLVRVIIQPTINVGVLFYHLKKKRYFASYYMVDKWVTFVTEKQYDEPKTNTLYVTKDGKVIFKNNPPVDSFPFNIVRVVEHYAYE